MKYCLINRRANVAITMEFNTSLHTHTDILRILSNICIMLGRDWDYTQTIAVYKTIKEQEYTIIPAS